MIKKILKIYSPKNINSLGVINYLIFLLLSAVNLHIIFRQKSLSTIDKKMAQAKYSQLLFNANGNTFKFDYKFCDLMHIDDAPSFGLARELYAKNCYFQHLPEYVASEAKYILDLGANRGSFSAMMTPKAKKIICVEPQKKYHPLIDHNMSINNFKNYQIESCLIGEGMFELEGGTLTISAVLKKHDLSEIDFVKMDIEGGEFLAFKDHEWLDRVKAIAMEVHQTHGDVNEILNVLRYKNFTTITADENLNRSPNTNSINYIFAMANIY